MKPNARIGWIAALVGLVFFSPIVSGQDKPLKKINWGVTSLSAGNWIPWIAKEAKIYEKYGLDVELILLRGSGQTSAAILGGSLYAAPVVLPTVMLADLSGADLVNVAHTVPGVQSKLLVRPEIRRAGRSQRETHRQLEFGFAGRFSLPLHSKKARSRSWAGNYLAIDRDAARTASSALFRCGGRCGSLLSDRRAGRKERLSRAVRCQKRGGLPIHVDRDPAKKHR